MYVLRFSTCSQYRRVDGNHHGDDDDDDDGGKKHYNRNDDNNNNKGDNQDNKEVERLALKVEIHEILRRSCRCSYVAEANEEDVYRNADDNEENGSGIKVVCGSISLDHNNDYDKDKYDFNYLDSNYRESVASLSEFYQTLKRCCGYCLDTGISNHNYYNDRKNLLLADMLRVSSVLATTEICGRFYSVYSDDGDGEYTPSDVKSIVAVAAGTAADCNLRLQCKQRVGSSVLFKALARNIELKFGGEGGDQGDSRNKDNYRCNGCETGCIAAYCCPSTSDGGSGGNRIQYRLIKVTAGEYLLEVRNDSEDNNDSGGGRLHCVQNQLINVCRDTLLQTVSVPTDEVCHQLHFQRIVLPNEELHIDDHYSFYTQLREATI